MPATAMAKPDAAPGNITGQLPSPLPSPTIPSLGAPGPQSNTSKLVLLGDRRLGDGSTHDELKSGASSSTAARKAQDPQPTASASPDTTNHHAGHVRRLSVAQMAELSESLPISPIHEPSDFMAKEAPIPSRVDLASDLALGTREERESVGHARPQEASMDAQTGEENGNCTEEQYIRNWKFSPSIGASRTVSTPPTNRTLSSNQQGLTQPSAMRRHSNNHLPRSTASQCDESGPNANPSTPPQKTAAPAQNGPRPPSPIPASIPLPPMSLPTILQLELAGQRPSPLYIHRSHASDLPYESSAIKFERLKNFLLLPSYLERTINFGALACLDAWLWTLTILPIRFFIAVGVLVRWWGYVVGKETRWVIGFVWEGLGRMWRRARRNRSSRKPGVEDDDEIPTEVAQAPKEAQQGNRRGTQSRRDDSTVRMSKPEAPRRSGTRWGHRRTKSMPSNLTSFNKADILQGAVIIVSSMALMNLDASRMYHFIRAQSAVKLYVIYNLVEVGDRLLSALGQDVFECLFSSETLSRNASGRSKVMLPLGMFLLALVYNVTHSIVLFYQVITLNVAVNSYSNALLSLLMSNQFVEVKSSVFKRTEKENTFQLACADIVERFQLWLVLFIIALRNIVEIGGLSVPGAGIELGADDTAKVPLHNTSILPASFTILPNWLVSGEVLSPFLIVIGSEMIVDWIKHAYINKFNNIKPNFYSRILDILCKDYYTNAFVAPALMRRLGLPLIPLCTLFIRSTIQTYHMFLATHVSSPLPPSTQTSLAVESTVPSSPAMIASLERLDSVIRNALGRAAYGNSYAGRADGSSWFSLGWSSDDLIAALTMIVVFFLTFLVLLMAKLLLGMALLQYSRRRYIRMKMQEQAEAAGIAEPESFLAHGRRTGGYGKVEVGEERRRWLFQGDPAGLQKVRDRERKDPGKGKKETDLSTITRYEMIAKRIW